MFQAWRGKLPTNMERQQLFGQITSLAWRDLTAATKTRTRPHVHDYL